MNGLSFQDFESMSFDALYDRGFAGAKDCDAMMQHMRPGELMSGARVSAPALQQASSRSMSAPRVVAANPAREMPMNDTHILPGNSSATSTWIPSAEADRRVRGLPAPSPSLPAAPRASAPPGGGQRGAFVSWKSN
eukprot:CAMPEP_0172665706 /NCGR_PEP_ID=MMETSP1074-20121228/7409_1 /TAXON_ID=2916 /ORGANISM="Ceratium fusus, Strain PA161109" /LENGTH=135 /DNA_ID=CAMNT_0013482047 /DNA_START=61 /DNA_END=468 /DNA_ORIENTATION=-